MFLFGLFSKKKSTKSVQKETVKTASDMERLNRLTVDGQLPYGWYSKNKAFTQKIENEHRHLVDIYLKNKHKSPQEWYAALKSLVQHTDDVRKLCASKDECFIYWSTALFGDKSYQELKDELEHVETHMDELITNYKSEQQIIKELPKIIRKNPGILQTEVYKMFPDECKGIVSSTLYTMDRNGKIIRTKSGRTYSLQIVETKKKAKA